MAERDPRAAAEVAAWYAARLRPKLLRAARERTISPAAASELEQQMTSMLRAHAVPARTGQSRLRRSAPASPRRPGRRAAARAGEVCGSVSAR